MKIFLIFLIVGISGIAKLDLANSNSSGDHSGGHENKKYIKGISKGSIKDFRIVKSLGREMSKEFIASYKNFDAVRSSGMSNSEILVNANHKYLSMQVILDDDHSGALKGPTQFTLPRGGGGIDFAEYVKTKRANFKLRIKVFVDDENSKEIINGLKVYFVSNAPIKKRSDALYGAGCNKYLDISSFFKKSLSGAGLVLNTTEQRYLGVVGGTFYLIYARNNELYLGAIKFYDSRYPDELCRN